MTDTEQARFEVLLEHLHDKMDVIAEGHAMLVQGQAELRAGQQRLEADVADLRVEMRVGFAELRGGLGEVRQDLAGLTGRVGRIEDHLGLDGPAAGPRRRRRAAKR